MSNQKNATLDLLKYTGISSVESELLSYLNNVVSDMIERIKDSTSNSKVKDCKELLKICIAIKQDILGDFPKTTLILNDLLWKLLIRALEVSCCCDNANLNPIYDDNSSITSALSNSTNSTCCLVLKQSMVDLLVMMVNNLSEFLNSVIGSELVSKSLVDRIIIFSSTTIPGVVNSAIRNCIDSHCECRIESIVSISDIINPVDTSSFNENLMRKTRLWTSIFKLISCCSDINSKLIKILEFETEIVEFNHVVQFEDIKVEILNSSKIMCKTLTNIYDFEYKGLGYYSILAFTDIFSQFIFYVFSIHKIFHIIGNTCTDIYLKDLMILLNNEFNDDDNLDNNYYEKIDVSKYICDSNLVEKQENNMGISFGINYSDINNKRLATRTLLNCINRLLIDKHVIEIESLRHDYKSTFRYTIIEILEPIFQYGNLEILDLINSTNQTLFIFDHIYTYIINNNMFIGHNIQNDENRISDEYIVNFIKSPNHTVSFMIFLLNCENQESLIRQHFDIFFDTLFSLKDSSFESLIFVTLKYLFAYIIENEQIQKNIRNLLLLFEILRKKIIQNRVLFMTSSLIFISQILVLKNIYYEKNEQVFISIKELIEEWENSAFIEYNNLHENFQLESNKIIGLQKSIILCKIYSESVSDNINFSNNFDFVLLVFNCFKKNRNIRRSAMYQLISFLGNKPSFPKNNIEIELLLDSQDDLENHWELNTKFVFDKYFTLTEFGNNLKNETKMSDSVFNDNVNDLLYMGYNVNTTTSPLKLPEPIHMSKILNIIKNNRIQTQIKLSAIQSITESLTSTKIPFKVLRLYTDELIKILVQHFCHKYLTNLIDDNYLDKNDTTLLGMTEIIYQEESSVFYYLSVAINAIIISRSYHEEFINYFIGNYSFILLRHLSDWLFSSSMDCRCSSSSLISTILIIILRTGLLDEQRISENVNEQELDKTSKVICISPSLNEILITPTSKGVVIYSNESNVIDFSTRSNLIYYPNNALKHIDLILNDINELIKRDSVECNHIYMTEIIFSIFSLSFPWTKLTIYAVHFETGELKIIESIESIFSKLIIFLNSSNFETFDDIANYLELLNISYFNVDLKLLAILKITYIILDSYYYLNEKIFTEIAMKYLMNFILISSFFNSLFKEKNFVIHIGAIRPSVSLNIFDLISCCFESYNGKLGDLFFEFLPDSIQWSFLVLQIPKLIEPLNSNSSPTTLMVVAKLLYKMPLRRWLEEDPRHTISCLKLLMENKKFICNKDFSEIYNVQTFQESSFVIYLLEIFEKISTTIQLNHPLPTYLHKNLLKWLYIVEMVSSSFEIQKRVWNLKVLLLNKWETEFSGSMYSIVSNMKIPEVFENNKHTGNFTWGFFVSHSLTVFDNLCNFLHLDNFVNFKIMWRPLEFCDYLSSILRFLYISLCIHYKPIRNISNNEIKDDIKLVSTTFNNSFEIVVDTLFRQLVNITFKLDDNEKTSDEIISSKLKSFTLKLIIAFLSKISAYSPFSVYLFDKFSENDHDLLLLINKLIISNVDDKIFYFIIQIIVKTIRSDSRNSNILQEQIYLILNNIFIDKSSYSEIIGILLSFNELLSFENESIKLNINLLSKITSISVDFFTKLSKTQIKNGDTINLINGFSILYYTLIKSKFFSENYSRFDSEFKVSLLTSILSAVSSATKFVVETSTIEDSFIDFGNLQDLLLISASSLTIIKSYNIDFSVNSTELKNVVLSIWSDSNKLIVYSNSFNIKNKERKMELNLFIDSIINIITMKTFYDVIINSVIEFDIFKFVQELYNHWLYINEGITLKSFSFYTLSYFSSLLYEIKLYLSENDFERIEINRNFNNNSFNIGFLNSIFEKSTDLLVEFREICLGELRSHTIASIRAVSNQKPYIYGKLKENAFSSRITCLFQLLKIIGIFLSEFEGPINLFTNKKMKPLLSFVVESLAFLNCITKQLESEIERNNPEGFTTCMKNWWLYTKKLTKGDENFDTFSNIFKQIISLTICCSSLIIPISDSKLLISEEQNSVPLSNITRSQKQSSVRLHDLFLKLLETESSIGLNIGNSLAHFPIEINDENGNLTSNITQKELNLLNGNDLKILQKNNLWLEGIILNNSVPVSIRSGALRLFINLGLSSSKKKFFKHWIIDETREKIKIIEIIDKSRATKNMEFLTLSIIFLNLILEFNSSPIFDSINKDNHCSYSHSQCEQILNNIEKIKSEMVTFQDYNKIIEQNPIILELIDKCCNNLKSKSK